MSNFYIENLENFATASQVISTTQSVVGFFVTPIRQWK